MGRKLTVDDGQRLGVLTVVGQVQQLEGHGGAGSPDGSRLEPAPGAERPTRSWPEPGRDAHAPHPRESSPVRYTVS